MKKETPWWVLIILAAAAYLLSYLIGGYISTVLNVVGLILLIFGIIRIFSKKKTTKDPQ
jgi:thiol:disulfide interchange protein